MEAIYNDDPNALEKLRAKLADLEQRQAVMTAINKAWRKYGKPKANDATAWATIKESLGSVGSFGPVAMASAVDAARLEMARDFLDRAPYSYHLSNNNGNIKRIRERINDLELSAGRETTEKETKGVRIVENVEANRLQLFFPGKPPLTTRAKLKASGFRWSPTEGAWQRHLNNNARAAADYALIGYGEAAE